MLRGCLLHADEGPTIFIAFQSSSHRSTTLAVFYSNISKSVSSCHWDVISARTIGCWTPVFRPRVFNWSTIHARVICGQIFASPATNSGHMMALTAATHGCLGSGKQRDVWYDTLPQTPLIIERVDARDF